jgi:DNA-binding transcriptional regulator YhcF (GntR family)
VHIYTLEGIDMRDFTMVQNEILNLELSGQAFKLYCILKSYCFDNKTSCFPSQKTLAYRLNKSVRTVQRALKELVKFGLVIVKRRGSISNIYELNIKHHKAKDNSKRKVNIHEKLNSLIEKHYNKSNYRNSINSNKNNFKNTYNNWESKKDSFNDYEQRNYDFNKLEAMLLGYPSAPENLSEALADEY